MRINENKYYKTFKIWHNGGYPYIWIDGKNVLLHVYIWELKNGNKPKKHDIHHIDFDKANYNLDNLLLVSLSEHKRYHAGWIKENNVWVKKPCNGCNQILELNLFYYIKTRQIQSSLCRKCSKIQGLTRGCNPRYKERKKQYDKERYRKKNEK